MNLLPVQCPQCAAALPAGQWNQPELAACPSCRALLQVEVFPALFREPKLAGTGEALVAPEDASCFYHPARKAVQPCEACGRFLCALCDCELNGQHLCPTCLEVGKKKGKLANLENRRTLYDSIALALAIIPLLIFYFTIVPAPLALYLAIRHWNTPTSIIRRTKVRFVAAIVLAALQMAGWGVGFYFLFTKLTA